MAIRSLPDYHKVINYDEDGNPVGSASTPTIAGPLGRKADALSVSNALSTEDVALLTALLTENTFNTRIGSLTETAPATDTASSGLNGRLQRIAQNISTLYTTILGIVGNIAHDGVDSGNPVKIGGYGSNAVPSVVSTDGDRVNAWLDRAGRLVVAAGDNNNQTDGLTGSGLFTTVGNTAKLQGITQYNFNGTNYDRVRSSDKTTVLASAARTATTSANLTLYNNCALLLVVDVTARAAATTLTPSVVMGQSGFVANKTIWTAAAAINTGSGTFMYILWPMPTIAVPTGYAEVVNVPLFRELQVTITHSDANSITYSVTAYTALLG